VSRQSTATSAFVSSPSPSAVSGVIHPSNLEPPMKSYIDSSIGFILYVTPASSSIVVCPPQVLKRGIVSDVLIHAFALDPQLLAKAFRPNHSCLSTAALIDIQDIRPWDSTPVFQPSAPLFLFRASSLNLSPSRYLKTHDNHSFFFQFLLSFGIPARIGLCDVGTPSLKRGIGR
jgi:hypothetical protein